MDSEKLKEILSIILDKLGDKEIIFRLDGSANLLVQGIKTDVNDLDLATDEKGMSILKEVLKDYLIQEYQNEDINALSLEFEIKGEIVEAHYYEDARAMLDNIIKVKWLELELPCISLEEAKKFYELINMPEKVKLIEKAI